MNESDASSDESSEASSDASSVLTDTEDVKTIYKKANQPRIQSSCSITKSRSAQVSNGRFW